ncbi:MAG: CarD family transcriptional regulator [Acidobacteria bacterium]|nr:CarD family transcriptional regulator [Acidobacteriota bacterium]
MTFQIGERVVYPNQGVGTIENISTRYFGSQMERFYLLRLASNSMTIMVPFSHVGDVGLRKVTRSSEIKKVLEYLATGKARKMADWKNRFKENSERMRCGSIFEVAEVFKILLLQQMEKTLSFREKKMLDRARQMMISEVSTSMALNEDGSVDLIAKSLSRAGLNMPEPM